MLEVIKNLVPASKYSIKCPHAMNPEFIVVHNTANDASARNEIAYMIGNNTTTSYHFAVDDKEIVQGIPLNRNAWHAGDGANGAGNRKGISIEICYSKSGGTRFTNAEILASKFIAQLLNERGWSIDKIKKHQDFSGKYCPHRTLDLGWSRFVNMCEAELKALGGTDTPSTEGLTINTGENHYVVDGVDVVLYKLDTTTEEFKLIANPQGVVKSIGQKIKELSDVRFMTNANYFENHTDYPTYGQIYGRCQGDGADMRPEQKEWLDFVQLKDGTPIFRDLKSWEYPLDEVMYGTSPAMCLIAGGTFSNEYSTAVGKSKTTTANTQTLLMVDWCNNPIIGVVDGLLTPDQIRNWLEPIKQMQWCFLMDSGGSSYAYNAKGKVTKYISYERLLPNYFAVVGKQPEPTPEPTPTEEKMMLVCPNAQNIRDKIVSGNVLITAPKGARLNVIRLIDGFQSDGYQWCEVEYNGIKGYAQIDTDGWNYVQSA